MPGSGCSALQGLKPNFKTIIVMKRSKEALKT